MTLLSRYNHLFKTPEIYENYTSSRNCTKPIFQNNANAFHHTSYNDLTWFLFLTLLLIFCQNKMFQLTYFLLKYLLTQYSFYLFAKVEDLLQYYAFNYKAYDSGTIIAFPSPNLFVSNIIISSKINVTALFDNNTRKSMIMMISLL